MSSTAPPNSTTGEEADLKPETIIPYLRTVMQHMKAQKSLQKDTLVAVASDCMKIANAREHYAEKLHELEALLREQQMAEFLFSLAKELEALEPLKKQNTEEHFVFKAFMTIFVLLANFTDLSRAFSEQLIALGFTKWFNLVLQKPEYIQATALIEYLVATTQNIVRETGLATNFSKDETKQALANIATQTQDAYIRMLATICLAYVLNGSETNLLNEGKHVIKDIFSAVKDAMREESRRCPKTGFSLSELLGGLIVLTTNDSVNQAVIDNDGVAILKELCNPGRPEELRDATKVLWNLLFNKQNRDLLKEKDKTSKENLQTFLEKLQTNLSVRSEAGLKEAKKNVEGCLWLLRGELVKTSEAAPAAASKNLDVFVSYCWNNKADVLKVRTKLRELGIPVWLDVEQMHGSTLEAMSNGIDNAKAVLLCYSEAYKNSPNCRMEAEYALQQRKPIIPLCMQTKYKPKSWLGFIIGAKLYYDFSGYKDFDTMFGQMFGELQTVLSGEQVASEPAVVPTPTAKVSAEAPHGEKPKAKEEAPAKPQQATVRTVVLKPEVIQWTTEQVGRWLQEQGLGDSVSNFRKIDGRRLARLLNIQYQAPEFFYSAMLVKMELLLPDLLLFLDAVEDTLVLK